MKTLWWTLRNISIHISAGELYTYFGSAGAWVKWKERGYHLKWRWDRPFFSERMGIHPVVLRMWLFRVLWVDDRKRRVTALRRVK